MPRAFRSSKPPRRKHWAKQGKSLQFEILVVIGYLFGLAGKFIANDVTYVVAVYILDLVMVSTDIVLTCRNMKLDRLAEKERTLVS